MFCFFLRNFRSNIMRAFACYRAYFPGFWPVSQYRITVLYSFNFLLRDRRLICAKYILSSNHGINIFCNWYNVTKPLIRALKLTNGQNSKKSIRGVTSERSKKWNTCSVISRRCQLLCLYRGADKSLARPGRKQATATEDFDFHISYL